MHAKVFSASTIGIEAKLVEVEVDISPGLINFYIVGLPDTAIKESSKRILTALKNSGINVPAKKITVNLAPADLKKEGTLFDLPITIGLLAAGQKIELLHSFVQETLFLGELSLDGAIRGIRGALAIASDAIKLHKKRLIVPEENVHEAAVVPHIEVIGVNHITQLIEYLRNEIAISPTIPKPLMLNTRDCSLDFSDVKGQMQAKRALQIAAAGRHNILFIGTPGSGKTMLARRLATIMPPMDFDEVIATNKIYSISGKLHYKTLTTQRPFRAPHHTISQAGLIGGGSYPQPGEISLAHNGILFLDELTEFKRDVLEALRQPLEQRQVCISRVQQSVTFPADPILVVALNPCPCGYWGDKKRNCACSPQVVEKYLRKLSGPFLDRIDLQVYVHPVEYDTIKDTYASSPTSTELYAAVAHAVERQYARFPEKSYNAMIRPEVIENVCNLTTGGQALIKKIFDSLCLSMRGYHKLLKVARTIADLADTDIVDVPHIQEAVMYRSLDHHLERTYR